MDLVAQLRALPRAEGVSGVTLPIELLDRLVEHLSWRWVPGLPYYEAHPAGRMRTYRSRGRLLRSPRALYPSLDKWGYPQFNVYDGAKWVRWRLHDVIAVTFLGERPPEHVVRHLDDNKENCRVENLVYGTHRENAADARRNRRVRFGGAKLTPSRVASLRDLAVYNPDPKFLATRFGISVGTVRDILAYRTWKDI